MNTDKLEIAVKNWITGSDGMDGGTCDVVCAVADLTAKDYEEVSEIVNDNLPCWSELNEANNAESDAKRITADLVRVMVLDGYINA